MTPELVQQILKTSFGATVDGSTYHIALERQCVLLIEHPQGIMQIKDVTGIDFGDDVLTVESEEETYYLTPQTVFGLKGCSPDKAAQRPGFRRP